MELANNKYGSIPSIVSPGVVEKPAKENSEDDPDRFKWGFRIKGNAGSAEKYPFVDDTNVKDYIFSKRLLIDTPFIGKDNSDKKRKWERLEALLLEHCDDQNQQIFPGISVETMKNRLKRYVTLTQYWLDKDGGGLDLSGDLITIVENDLDNPEYDFTNCAAKIKHNVEKLMILMAKSKDEAADAKIKNKENEVDKARKNKFFQNQALNFIKKDPKKMPASNKTPPPEDRLGDIKTFMTVYKEKEQEKVIKREERQKRKQEEQEEAEQKIKARNEEYNEKRKDDAALIVETVSQAMVPLAEALVKSFTEALKNQGNSK